MKRVFSLLGAALPVLQVVGSTSSPPVNVGLRSSWPAPPFLAEILETISLENPSAFFTLLDSLTDPETLPSPDKLSPEAIHQAALQIAVENGVIQEPEILPVINMNLAMHVATPKLEAFYNYYADAHNDSRGTECGSWVDWYGEVVCDVEGLAQLAGVESIDPPTDTKFDRVQPKILTFDHIYPPPEDILERPPRTAILYASLTSSNFRELHTYLLRLTNRLDPHVEYVFRHIPPKTPATEKIHLSGYGVALDLKKMDYLALDDRNTNLGGVKKTASDDDQESQPKLVDPIQSLILSHPENLIAPGSDAPLTEEEFESIGRKAVQIIADSSEPLDTLAHLSQNFPKYVTSLARRVIVNESIAEELHNNSIKVQRGISVMWFNGLQVDAKDVNPFGLLRTIKKERKVVQSLTSLGLERSQALELLTHSAIAAAQKDSTVMEALFDASDRSEGGDVIVWWNDMEKDSRYAKWSPSLYALLRPMYPGAMPSIRANLFNIVLILDLSQTVSLNFIAGPVTNIISRDIPLRFGLVPTVETEDGMKMARLFYHLIKNYGRKRTLSFISAISQVRLPGQLQTPKVEWETVREVYAQLGEEIREEKPEAITLDLDSIFKGEGDDVTPIEKINAYSERLGSTLALSEQGHAFFNGKHFDVNEDFLRQLQAELGVQMGYLQEKVYEGSLLDSEERETMSNYFYDLPTTSKRRNSYIYPSTGSKNIKIVNLPDFFERTLTRLSASTYIYPPPEAENISESLYVIADLDSPVGHNLVKEAASSLTAESKTRISFIHNPAIQKNEERSTASWLFAHLHTRELLSEASPSLLLSALGFDVPAAPVEGTQIPIHKTSAFERLTGVTLADIMKEEYIDYMKSSRLVSRELGLLPGQSALVVNGRVVGPIAPNDFLAADFKALEDHEFRKRTEPIVKALQDIVPFIADDKYRFANIVSMSSSVIASTQQPDPSEIGLFDAPPRPRQRSYELLDSEYTTFQYGDNSTALHHVAVLLDPLSETAQKWSSLLKWLSNIPDIFIEIHLNPAPYKDMPLKRFYRYNLASQLNFDNEGREIPAKATFEDIPVDPIYTLAMDVPTAWLVRPREALYDLDNIQLGKLFPGDTEIEAVFDLDYLVIEGHAREIANQVPRGVQLQLVTSDGASVDDTQVVANLGYFQFKAKPGVFKLEIREGRGRKIFKLDSAGNEGWESPLVEEAGAEITVTSFEGLTLYPRLSRNPGMEVADVLVEDTQEEESKGIFGDISSRVKSIFKSSKKDASTEVVTTKPQAEINIFTVASGLLYERFVGIMILSVLRNTNSTVKFWFIENFLSPSFLEFIPHMAEKYNFQYELVTYKWPSWLRAQTEKQRIIWAYKILFLDVLFPMDLKKVIFVDADQIVRADLKELVDLDLHGAPYGYTPMGDDNTDMEGFRFWKTGYWKEFLQGKPYHISALYVIDLVRFRQMAAGDILRGQYHQLSADPNSLANLDQDLPNNLQAQVPIYSLGEDWLWCETWCSKDRLHRAKTIDLCQNPLTKEPKLARARQIPEWDEYDTEIARFTRDLAEAGKVHSRIATADASVLAGGAGATTASEEDSKKDDLKPEGVEEKVSVDSEDEVPTRDEL